MRKLLTSTLVVVSLIAAVGQATFALFSDTEEVIGNTITVGDTDASLSLSGEGEGESVVPVTGDDLLPGEYTDWQKIDATNSNPDHKMKLYFYVKDVNGGACDFTNLELQVGDSDGTRDASDVFMGNVMDIDDPADRVEVTGADGFMDKLMPGETAFMQLRSQLDESATNEVQGDYCYWTSVFVGELLPDSDHPISFPEEVS